MSAFLLLLASAYAEPSPSDSFPPVRERSEAGVVDWTTFRLEASASSERTVGAWKDQRIREQDALDRLEPRILALAPEVRITPDSTAGDRMAEGDELAQRLSEGLRLWKVEETRYISTGRVEMDAALDLQAWLRPALVALARAEPPPAPTGTTTGLLVDARGLGFQPCLLPRLSGPDGRVLFEAGSLSADTVRRGVPVVYVTDPADPRAFPRVGDHPLFARGASVASNGDLVLDAADAGAIAQNADFPALAAAGRVVFVVDP